MKDLELASEGKYKKINIDVLKKRYWNERCLLTYIETYKYWLLEIKSNKTKTDRNMYEFIISEQTAKEIKSKLELRKKNGSYQSVNKVNLNIF